MGGGRRPSDHLPSELADEVASSSSDHSSITGHHSDIAGDELSRRRLCEAYLEVMQSYEASSLQTRALQDAKDAIKSHEPGDWMEGVGGTVAGDYEIPETTTLLLIGPRGSGKSTLVNRISRVFDDDPFAPDRAQVSYNLSATEGSCFLQEYMIPRSGKSLCVYDSRSLSPVSSDNLKLLKSWMTRGVYHGEMVIRDSDDVSVRKNIKAMARQGQISPCQRRTVNFVIFVVDGVSVLSSMDGKDTHYNDIIVETYNYPFLSFKDNKPVVVVTHGDGLSLPERARIRSHLGMLLGIPPTRQIFDIPGTSDYDTELAIVDMLRYSIEHADRNLPFKQNHVLRGQKILLRMMDKVQEFDVIVELLTCLCIGILLMRLLINFKTY